MFIGTRLIYKEFAFHNFWPTICENVSHESKEKASKLILESEEAITKHAELITAATMEAIAKHHSPPSGSYHLLLSFFSLCTRWNATIMQCNPPLELLPINKLPKRGTPLNNIIGQQFNLDFTGNELSSISNLL